MIDRQKLTPEVKTAIQFNDPKETITNVIKLFRATGGVQCRFTPGRPQVSTPKQDKLLIRLSKTAPDSNAVELKVELPTNY
jgi:hypothetical protein